METRCFRCLETFFTTRKNNHEEILLIKVAKIQNRKKLYQCLCHFCYQYLHWEVLGQTTELFFKGTISFLGLDLVKI